MSDRERRFYLDDMIKFCQKILSYTERLDQNRENQVVLAIFSLLYWHNREIFGRRSDWKCSRH